MKRIVYTLYIIIATTCAALTSCDGVHISENGDLDGMWHLVEVDSLGFRNSAYKTADYTEEGIFWSVQSKLLCVEDKNLRYQTCLLRFEHKDGRLSVFDPYLYNYRQMPDEMIEDPSLLFPFGINSLEDSFEVKKLNHKQMILSNSILQLKFKRY